MPQSSYNRYVRGLLLILSALSFSVPAVAQTLGPLDPLSLPWLEKQVRKGDPTMENYDAFLFKLMCRRGGGIDPTKWDIERMQREGAGKKVLAFLRYRLERKTDKLATNPCNVTNVVLADFYNVANVDSTKRAEITSEIRKKLISLTAQFPDLNVVSLNSPILEQAGRQEIIRIAKQHEAAVVIWGNFTQVEHETKISAWVESLNYTLPVSPTIEISGPGEGFQDLKMTGNMARDLKTMLLLTMGVISQHAYDPPTAINYYAEALKQPNISSDIAFQAHLSLVFIKFKTKMFLSQAELKEMIDELENAVKNLNPKSAAAHLQLLRLYAEVDSVKAIENGNKAINLADTPQQRIAAYLGFAHFYDDIKSWKGVEENAKKAIDLLNLEKQTIETKQDLVRAYRLLRDKENADKQIREAIAMIEGDPQADAYDYLMKGALETFIGRYDLMEKSFIKALEMKPNLIQANIGLGALYSKFGDEEKNAKHADKALNFYQRALTFANKAIEDDPTVIDAYMFRAQTYRSMEKVDESAADYQRVLTLDPTFRTAHLALSSLYAVRKDYDRAFKYINQAIATKKDPLFFSERGTYYLETGKRDLALADFLMSQELMAKDVFKALKNPAENRVNLYDIRDQAELFNRQMNALTSRKDFQAGIILCDKFTALYDLKGKMAFVHQIKSSLLYEDSKLRPSDQQSIKLQEALSEINQAISLEPNNVDYHSKRLLILVDLKEFSEGIAEADKIISFDPTNPTYYMQRSLVHLEQNNLDGVIQDMEKALANEKDEKEKLKLRQLIEGTKELKKQEEGKKKIDQKPVLPSFELEILDTGPPMTFTLRRAERIFPLINRFSPSPPMRVG